VRPVLGLQGYAIHALLLPRTLILGGTYCPLVECGVTVVHDKLLKVR